MFSKYRRKVAFLDAHTSLQSSCRLPNELVDYIIDFTFDDPAALRTFQLVSKAWLDAIAYHLYPSSALCVPHVSLPPWRMAHRHRHTKHLSLHSLSLLGCRRQSDGLFGQSQYQVEFRSQHARWNRSPTPRTFVEFVAPFAHLETLDVSSLWLNVVTEKDNSFYVSQPFPPSLRRLVAGSVSSFYEHHTKHSLNRHYGATAVMAEWVQVQKPSIKRLTVVTHEYGEGPEGTMGAAVGKLLRALPLLEELDLLVEDYDGETPNDTYILTPFDLSLLAHLKTVRLTIPVHMSEHKRWRIYTCLARILQTLPSQLEVVVFALTTNPMYACHGSFHIDTRLDWASIRSLKAHVWFELDCRNDQTNHEVKLKCDRLNASTKVGRAVGRQVEVMCPCQGLVVDYPLCGTYNYDYL